MATFPATLPVREGERVRLRAFRAEDADDVFTVFSDPTVMRYWSAPPMRSRTEAEDYVARGLAGFAEGQFLPWAVALREHDRAIGAVTLFALRLDQGRAELGYVLGSAHWGRGLAREAAGLALDVAFGTLGLRRLEADADPRNRASCGLLERLGFVREGYLRERWCVDGEIQDAAFYGLLARERRC